MPAATHLFREPPSKLASTWWPPLVDVDLNAVVSAGTAGVWRGDGFRLHAIASPGSHLKQVAT
jgi:hypothetical protein